MKFFFPDSQDLVDPSFDFVAETRSRTRQRHRDDLYAHEVFTSRAFDGLLVSKGIVDGFSNGAGKYTLAQRQRLLRVGVKEFFRLASSTTGAIPVMGDCGAFTYAKENEPPYSVSEVLDFYASCDFDLGISVDHVILCFERSWDGDARAQAKVPDGVRARQALTLTLAEDFLRGHAKGRHRFTPLGVAQGWSPNSYAVAVSALQDMGYRYIAVGGMVPLKNDEIIASLTAIDTVRRHDTRLHLLGVTRIEHAPLFASLGVASFDSTSPLRQAFKDATDNYYAPDRMFTAVRVPQVEGNPKLLRGIRSGKISQERARTLEQACLRSLQEYDEHKVGLEEVLERLKAYEDVYDPGHDHTSEYRAVLSARPWRECPCDVCRKSGYQVIVFRGAERNRRRGFHNLWVFYRQLRRELGLEPLLGDCAQGKAVDIKEEIALAG